MSQDVQPPEPIAIIGMSCRFAPDLNSPEKFWDFLAEGRNTVGEMPAKRWDPYAAKSPQATAILRGTTRLAAFMDDVEGFDADFFGISPREAEYLDPQQRIILELAWEALEDAGLPPLSLGGSEAGVFVSANTNDYGRRLLEDIPRTGAYAVNGTTYYGIANRVSYFLDLRGPSMAVDTACAGSLTALHVACQSLRSGETPVAIVGGVNVMATPALVVALDAAGATAPDGRSKAFDRYADGYGRGEGAGVVVLKRLSDAERDGDQILALVRGSGVFQDGRSDGMMAPNGQAQEHMLRQTYLRAGVSPGDVGYVEAHGTGTPVGDREEAQALAAVFGAGRDAADPCLIGSVKPNIGHTEATSGMAGIIKAVLALRNGMIPSSLHTEPNPDFDWDRSGLRLVGEPTPWPAGGSRRFAGVSSYGVGGTTAHAVIEEAPAGAGDADAASASGARPATPDGPARPGQGPSVFPLSAMSDGGLRALATTLADWIEQNPDAPASSIGHTLALRRSHLSQRAAIVAHDTAELTERLRVLAEGRRLFGVAKARTAAGRAAEAVWVFSGHGAQWSGMGRQLLEQDAAFAAAIDELAYVYAEEMGWTPREMLVRGGPWSASEVQALTFAMQIGLAAVWLSKGVRPGAVIGHSVGEIAAAVAAGALDAQAGARFACRRAKALRPLEGAGAMALVSMSFEDCQSRLGDRTDVVAAIAAAPTSTVVSGDRDAVLQVVERWRGEGVEVWNVDSDIAFHSTHVDSVLQKVLDAAAVLRPRPTDIPLYSSALADPRSQAARDAAYWGVNLREPVRFNEAVQAAIQDGHRVFLELSSHPVVTHSITETLAALGVEGATVAHSVRRDSAEVESILGTLAELHCDGAAVDWSVLHSGGEFADLPTMAWQHRPYWIFPEGADDSGSGGGHDPEKHSLLGGLMSVSGAPARQVWQTHLDMSCRPYPQSHEVVDVEITPAASIVNSFIKAAGRDDERPPVLADLVLRTPLAVTPPRVVQIVLAENTLRLASRIAEGGSAQDLEQEWITHTTATAEPGRDLGRDRFDAAAVRSRCDDEWDWDRVDGLFRTKGVGGYAFPWDLGGLYKSDDEQLSILTLVPPPAEHSASWAHVVDGALTISAVLVTPEDADKLWMSSFMGSVAVDGEPPARITVYTKRSERSPVDTVDVLVADDSGKIVCEVVGLRFAALQDRPGGALTAPRDLVHETVWRPLPLDGPTAGGVAVDRVVVVGDGVETDALAERFRRSGTATVAVAAAEELAGISLQASDAVIAAPARIQPGEKPEHAAERCAWALVDAAQRMAALLDAEAAAQPRLWGLTRGVRDARQEASLAHAPLWGVGRIIGGEHPELWGGVIDLDDTEADAEALVQILRHAAGEEDVISVSGGTATVARLAPVDRTPERTGLKCRPSGTYLITGGLGALGLEVARYLVDRGATRILLAGRTGLPPRSEWAAVTDPRVRRQIDGILELEALGVTVKALALDITDAAATAEALSPASHGLPPVAGVIHAAGVTRDAMVDNVERAELHDVLGPKAVGAMVLHRLFAPGSLDFFVSFSSSGQFAHLTGQTTYAAANSFLDALAAHRQASGHVDSLSIGWTSWRGVGMSEDIGTTMLEANARGLAAITAAEAFRAWAFADRFQNPYLAILKVLPTPPHARKVPMFRELTAVESETGTGDADGFALDWSAPVAELLESVTADVREQVASELRLDPEDVELRRPLVELGVDSVMTVALRVRLTRRFGLDLPPTILWNKPTVAALGEHIVEELRPRDEEGAETEAGAEVVLVQG